MTIVTEACIGGKFRSGRVASP